MGILSKAQKAARAARKAKEAAKTVEKKGSIAKKMTVSKTDIQQADTAVKLDAMQRRIDNMDDGLIKQSMQGMLDRQRAKFEKMQADELDKAGRKSAQSARDRKPFKGYDPSKDLPFKRGGLVKTGHMDMRKGGMFYK